MAAFGCSRNSAVAKDLVHALRLASVESWKMARRQVSQ